MYFALSELLKFYVYFPGISCRAIGTAPLSGLRSVFETISINYMFYILYEKRERKYVHFSLQVRHPADFVVLGGKTARAKCYSVEK